MPITNNDERIIGERNTKAFIEANPVTVVLRRPQMAETESGGVRKLTPLMIAAQQFRIVPMSGLVWDRSRTTPDEGMIQDVTEQCIGMPSADIQINDYFPAEYGGWYKVHHVSPVKGYRKEARLRWLATEPRTGK